MSDTGSNQQISIFADPVSERAMAGFMLSTMAVGIRIVVPRRRSAMVLAQWTTMMCIGS
ncbi:hypothetical protein AEGHOMDF_6141 [Methylobacterium soli]|nr:hypothetical protein AEGHOMDF_6141 [Methylobacterium soli]